MKEFTTFRIKKRFAHYLRSNNQGKEVDTDFREIIVESSDPLYKRIGEIAHLVRTEYDELLFLYWKIERKYTSKELADAQLFSVHIKKAFEPSGEETGTIYDTSSVCDICGSGKVQVGPLRLRKSSIPKKDISRTIASEVVVSKRLKKAVIDNRIDGIEFNPVLTSSDQDTGFFQPVPTNLVDLSDKTIAGIEPFNFAERFEEKTVKTPFGDKHLEAEVYKCPKCHTIGLNILSEVYVKDSKELPNLDFFASRQKWGVNRGLLQTTPVYLCSPKFRQMVLDNKLTGFEFEVAHIVR